MAQHILIINGSYKQDGIISQALTHIYEYLQQKEISCEMIWLQNEAIEFCTNCKECTQSAGDEPTSCIFDDAMTSIIEKIEHADKFIIASPTNMSSVTALYKRFMERLVVYAYWPWGLPSPKYRKADLMKKKGIILASSAMPSFMGYLFTNTLRSLKLTLKIIGARCVGTYFIGLASMQKEQKLAEKDKAKLLCLTRRLLRS